MRKIGSLKNRSGRALILSVLSAFIWCFFWVYIAIVPDVASPAQKCAIIVLPMLVLNYRFKALPYLFFISIILCFLSARGVVNAKDPKLWSVLYIFSNALLAVVLAVIFVALVSKGLLTFG